MVPAKRPTLWTFLGVMRNQSLPTKRFTQQLYKADAPELQWFPQMMIYNMCWSLPFLNELWITGMREFLLRGIKTLHGNNLLIWEQAKMFLVAAIIHVWVCWKYQVFNLRPFIPSYATGMILPWEKSTPYVDKEKSEFDVRRCETETSVIEICIFRWYTLFRFMLKLSKYAQAAEIFFSTAACTAP